MQVNSSTLEFENLTNDDVWLLVKQQPLQGYNALRESACELWFDALGTPGEFDKTVGMYNLVMHGMVMPKLGFAVARWVAINGMPTEPDPVE